MPLQSLGYRTDLMFRRFEGEVVERGRYLVVRTPRNPGYRWGNFLIFDQAPREGDLERWKALFAREIGTPPAYAHFAFGWDGAQPGAVGPFLEAGFRLEQSAVLSARGVVQPPKLNPACVIRPLLSDADWEERVELALAVNDAEPPGKREGEGYRDFVTRKAEEYRRMVAAGLGQWFGAYLEGRLAATLGLFVWEGLGRFQSVETHPAYRRQGLCGTLVYHASRIGLREMGAQTLVMVADPGYVAIRIYESVGFRVSEPMWGLEWHPTDA